MIIIISPRSMTLQFTSSKHIIEAHHKITYNFRHKPLDAFFGSESIFASNENVDFANVRRGTQQPFDQNGPQKSRAASYKNILSSQKACNCRTVVIDIVANITCVAYFFHNFSSFDPLSNFLFIFQIFRARDLIRLYRSTLCKELANVAAYNCCRFLVVLCRWERFSSGFFSVCAHATDEAQSIVNFVIYRADVHDTEFFLVRIMHLQRQRKSHGRLWL